MSDATQDHESPEQPQFITAPNEVEFELSIKEISFKFKGNSEIARGVQTSINQLMNSITQVQNQLLLVQDQKQNGQSILAANNTGKDGGGKIRSIRTRRTTGDNTLGSQLAELVAAGFFDVKRNANEIKDELSKKGHNHEAKNIASALVYATQKKTLQREKNAEGNWTYWKA